MNPILTLIKPLSGPDVYRAYLPALLVMCANELSDTLLNAFACCWLHIACVRKFDTGSDLLSQPCRTLEQFCKFCDFSLLLTAHVCFRVPVVLLYMQVVLHVPLWLS